MLNYPDMCTTASTAEAGRCASEFLAVATFLKPSFRIAVGPRTGQLSVVVQASSVAPVRCDRGAQARH